MNVELQVSSGMRLGRRTAKLLGVAVIAHSEFGLGLRWEFEVCRGRDIGLCASRITSLDCNETMFKGILGRPPEPDEKLDLSSFIGKTCLISIGQKTANGWLVERVHYTWGDPVFKAPTN